MEMQRIRIAFACAGLIFPLAAFSQISEEEILALLERNEIASARERIDQAHRQYPNSAVAAYFHAVLEDDGETANKSFQEVAARFRGTIYAERALFRLGQYHYAEGTYNRARQYFTDLIAQYPKSSLAPQASYYAAKSLVIIGNLSQAREELSRCTKNYPGTWITKFAVEDLAKLQHPTSARKEKSAAPASKRPLGIYTVEIGPFNSRDNAVSQLTVFAKAGYSTEMKEQRKGQKVSYKAWVGDFIDRKQARKFAEETQRKLKVRCKELKR
jgi:outer membrane protein assembly factor BamD (BamD/ComL family)